MPDIGKSPLRLDDVISAQDKANDEASADLAAIADGADCGPYDPDELVRWAETYGHPEHWAKSAQAAHARAERLHTVLAEAAALIRDGFYQRAAMMIEEGLR